MGLFNFFKKKKVISYSKEELDTVLQKYFHGDKRFWAQEAVILGRPYKLELKTEMSLLLNSILIYEFYSNVDEKELMERLLNNNYAKVPPETAIKFFHDAIKREVPSSNDNQRNSANSQDKKYINIYSPKGTSDEDASEDEINADDIIPLEHPIMLAIFKNDDLHYVHKENGKRMYSFETSKGLTFYGEEAQTKYALSASVFTWFLYCSKADVSRFDKAIGVLSHSYNSMRDLVFLSASKTASQCVQEVQDVFPSFDIQLDFNQYLGLSQRMWLEVMALDRFINKDNTSIMDDNDFVNFMNKGGAFPAKMMPSSFETEDDIYKTAVYESLIGKVDFKNIN